jgi:hypothetical protein
VEQQCLVTSDLECCERLRVRVPQFRQHDSPNLHTATHLRHPKHGISLISTTRLEKFQHSGDLHTGYAASHHIHTAYIKDLFSFGFTLYAGFSSGVCGWRPSHSHTDGAMRLIL